MTAERYSGFYYREREQWSPDECKRIEERFLRPMRISEIAYIHRRTPETIEWWLIQQSLLPATLINLVVGNLGNVLQRENEPWDDQEIARLDVGSESGFAMFELSLRHKRSIEAVHRKLTEMGLLESGEFEIDDGRNHFDFDSSDPDIEEKMFEHELWISEWDPLSREAERARVRVSLAKQDRKKCPLYWKEDPDSDFLDRPYVEVQRSLRRRKGFRQSPFFDRPWSDY